jgi:anti-sigma-K factor RskA/putative zinc finger protein
MTHEDLRDQAAAYVIGALDPVERREFEEHLSGCAECQAEVRSLDRVPEALACLTDWREPSPALRARIVGTRAPIRRVAVAPWLAMAASIALVLLTPYTLRLRDETQRLSATVRDLTARLLDRDRQLVAVRSEVSLLAAPDVRRVDLRGQQAAPRAGARAFWSQTRGVYFVASNLPAIPAGKDYQLWFVTTTGPVSASVFKPDEQGRAEITAGTRPNMAPLTALAVTLEPAGGVPAPTGDMYLVGPVSP